MSVANLAKSINNLTTSGDLGIEDTPGMKRRALARVKGNHSKRTPFFRRSVPSLAT
jgi:hypothetical protein